MCRSSAISLNVLQNASSRLTLVLWRATKMERLTTEDLIFALHCRFGVLMMRANFLYTKFFLCGVGLSLPARSRHTNKRDRIPSHSAHAQNNEPSLPSAVSRRKDFRRLRGARCQRASADAYLRGPD